jgi:hypothetical protein
MVVVSGDMVNLVIPSVKTVARRAGTGRPLFKHTCRAFIRRANRAGKRRVDFNHLAPSRPNRADAPFSPGRTGKAVPIAFGSVPQPSNYVVIKSYM